MRLLSIAKLQNLKAIHNTFKGRRLLSAVVINRKTTKFESNSQPQLNQFGNPFCCYQSQNYKIWKQFTTYEHTLNMFILLLSIAKLQNLKAIHNINTAMSLMNCVVINRKTTKFESNSQPMYEITNTNYRCYQSQNYKIWKQFTTASIGVLLLLELLSIAKLQNLKAIHNESREWQKKPLVVINRKTTKFESNSQRMRLTIADNRSCYQSQNYKIWKQFTTLISYVKRLEMLLSIAKLQNLKAIHNCGCAQVFFC